MRKYLFKFKISFLLTIIFIILAAILNVALAAVVKIIVQIAENRNIHQFKIIIFVIVVYLILLFITGVLKKFFQANLIKKIMFALKKDIFSKIIDKDISNFNSENTAQYISVLTNDLKIIESEYYNNILDMIYSAFSFFMASSLLIMVNFYIALGVFIATIITIFVPQVLSKKLQEKNAQYSNELANFIVKIKDIFSGFEVIKCFNIKDRTCNEYNICNNNVEKAKFDFSLVKGLSHSLALVLGMMMMLTALGLGAYFTIIGTITVSTMLGATQLMNNIANPIIELSSYINILKSIKPLEEKINMIMETNNLDKGTICKKSFDNNIEFKNITFAYDDKVILDNISLKIEKGKKYAIVGESGSGKSTLVKLLVKYYNNYKGNILIDGLSNREIFTEYLYKIISIIHQDVFLFDGTIKENITLLNQYTEDEIYKALKLSGLYDTINSFANSIDTLVGENGSSLSGGQKQRISIARALIRKTPIIILDEATAALDGETSYNIENSMLNIKDLTAIVITHKLSKELLKKYDYIITIKNGKILEIGTFENLINKKGYFYSLYNIQ